ncbi:interferon-induced protein with tetratricopeptide repeats 5-like isoform X2 [Micropterus dolomieu]|uniref:interferon-induced protein with tetratricopeptide repeats 5-like isoform X1 n=1 Tax=Micropterus dolomieu TaxID=147949 RepID=UPI001E8DC41F|nr:interferon-induced protein with tetratricopeptide repeats 5-like isoform X1 [Micropterus dolomieu]XP_045925593.1 interferon-induced protein with tetratricopeptide repeats 5-like isoform X2 [Micropterus dolomieu]
MSSSLHSRLQQLQSRFTWDLKEEDMDLENLSIRLQEHIDLQLGQQSAVALSYSFLAYVRYLQGRRQEAMSLLNQSEEKTRECYGEESERRLIVTYGDQAWLKYHTGDYTQSHSYCQRVDDILVKYPTGSSTVLHPEVYGEKAWTFLKCLKAYYPKAIDCFRKALELQPDDSEWNAGCAIALYRTEPSDLETSQEDEESPAIKQLRRALEINPDDGVLLSMLALKLTAHKKHQEAEALVERALEKDPDNPHAMRYIAKYLRIQGEDGWSIDLLRRALKRTNQSAFIHHQLAMCYKKKQHKCKTSKAFNKQEAKQWKHLRIQHLEEAVKIKPSFVVAIADLALLHGQEMNLRRAEELFQQAFQNLATDKGATQAFHLNYADFYLYHTKQEAKAIPHYIEGLRLTQDTWEWNQCVMRLKMIAERHLSYDKNDAQSYGLLGLVAKAEGKKKKAEEFYEKALDCDENNDEYLSALCELRMELQ